jgi:hypothetical protein
MPTCGRWYGAARAYHFRRAGDPRGLLRAIRRALKPEGIYVCLDINSSDKLEEHIGLLGAMSRERACSTA